MKVAILEQRSADWHAWRSDKLCASDAAAYLSCSPYKTKDTLMREKAGLSTPEDISNLPHIQAGIAAEEQMLNEISDALPQYIVRSGVCVESDEFSWVAASLDAYIEPEEGSSITPIEFKWVGRQRFEDFLLTGVVPEHFRVQLLHQAITVESKIVYLVMANKAYKKSAFRIIGFSDSELKDYIESISKFPAELMRLKKVSSYSIKKITLIPKIPMTMWGFFNKSCAEIRDNTDSIKVLKDRINALNTSITEEVFGGSMKKSGRSLVFSRVPKGRVLVDEDSKSVVCDFLVEAC